MLDLPPCLPQMTLALPAAAGWDPAKASPLQETLRPRARCRSQTVPYHGAEGPEHVRPSQHWKQDKVLAFSHIKGWL